MYFVYILYSEKIKLTVDCGIHGVEVDLCKELVDKWCQDKGYEVEYYLTPSLPFYLQMMAAKSSQVDLLLIDIVWAGLLTRHLVHLEHYFSESYMRQYFRPIVENNMDADGHLLAVPVNPTRTTVLGEDS